MHYTYVHDRLGRLLHSKNELNGEKIQRTYDAHGRLLTEQLNGIILQSKYNTKGQRTELILPVGTIQYEYDPFNLRKVTFGNVTHQYTKYDTAGNLLQEETPFGTITRNYDAANYPSFIKSPHFSHEVQYDPVHNIVNAEIHGDRVHYNYDPLYQVTSDTAHSYRFDAYHNRLAKDESSYQVNTLDQLSDFTYDETLSVGKV